MTSLRPGLEKILQWLIQLRRPVVRRFRPGLPLIEITRQMTSAGLKPQADVSEFYGWRNGTNTWAGDSLDDIHFFPGFYFLSLEDSIEQYLAIQNDRRWRKQWMPLFTNGGGDFFVADLQNSTAGRTPILGFMLGAVEQPVRYESLSSMILTLAECFNLGIVEVTPEGYLEWDDLNHASVAKRFNPGLEFWRD